MHNVIALDADGVLLDYSLAYARAWRRAFGTMPEQREPKAYWPIDCWGVERLAGERLAKLKACFDEEFWSTMPAVAGSLDASRRLVAAGYRLICVTAVESSYAEARRRNLFSLGFPLDEVLATGSSGASPKAATINALSPAAFVDDYLPYHDGVAESVHQALILRAPIGSPNTGPGLQQIDSTHVDLQAFADWWLSRGF